MRAEVSIEAFRRMVEMVNRPNGYLAHMPNGLSMRSACGGRYFVAPTIPHQFDRFDIVPMENLGSYLDAINRR